MVSLWLSLLIIQLYLRIYEIYGRTCIQQDHIKIEKK